MSKRIPDDTIAALGRSIHKEARRYGFGQLDVVRLINQLMDLSSSAAADEVRDPKGPVHPDSLEPISDELPIAGERVRIRPLDYASDAALFDTWLKDRYGRFFLLSAAQARSAPVSELIDDADNHLAIITLLDGKPIGALAFLDHSRQQKRAELRKLIGDVDARGQGLAEEATRLWIRYGVGRLGLQKIYVSTLQTHIRNVKLNEQIGFRVEGLLRNEVCIDGERHDVLRMGFWQD